MILISHRGNISGSNLERENTGPYIQEALDQGYEVEIDVWYKDNTLFLGHDGPKNKTNLKFISKNSLWCHAKSIEALNYLIEQEIRCFWHQEDDIALTYPKMLFWTYPGKKLTNRSICVHLGPKTHEIDDCYGVCSDYISTFGAK